MALAIVLLSTFANSSHLEIEIQKMIYRQMNKQTVRQTTKDNVGTRRKTNFDKKGRTGFLVID